MLRRLRIAAIALCLTLTLAIASLVVLGEIRPTWYTRGGFGAGVTGARLELARSNSTLTRQANAWGLQHPYGSASILVAPSSRWLPSRSPAAVGMSGPGAPAMFTLDVLYIPLWLPLGLSSLVTFTLFALARRRLQPGHCRCGYDLRGINTGRCPECGRQQTTSLAARLSAAIRSLAVSPPRANPACDALA